MKEKFKLLISNRIVKNIGVLTGGTAIAQVIAIAVLPVLTRIYTPNDFEIFALFISILSIFGVAACLRIEVAIPMPESKKTAIALVLLSIGSAVLVTFLSFLLILVLYDSLVLASDGKLDSYIWLLPVCIFLVGLYSAFQYWATRQKEFFHISKTRIAQSVSGSGVQVGFGVLSQHGSAFGLIIGHVIQLSAGVITLGLRFYRDGRDYFHQITTGFLVKTFKEYIRFPKYSVLESLANTSGLYFAIVLMAIYAIDAEAGFIFLAIKLLSAPLSMLGGSVAQVYLSEAPKRKENGELKVFTFSTIKNLFFVGFFPLLLVGLLSPYLIPYVFGADWERTGILISWMIPWFLLQFVVSPVSMVLHLQNKSSVALWLQIFGLVLRVGSVAFAFLFFPLFVGEIFALSGFVFYLVYLAGVFLAFECDR
ncbi:lipopolysaccharide biosynthesis protein [Thalassolituus sp. UBA2009]|uniref:lipopolysaccharide biosynthesis protein n=1 Tax=Thalassolituus sp. UBA2009 TaxID=1947658 RepID=UPI00257957C8|nr:lipopolysaccharide biosynthesis protein [Thalassolituus sp. UBA2009]